MMTGSGIVFRGDRTLGVITYYFDIDDDGRVRGRVVHEDLHAQHPALPRVPVSFLPADTSDNAELKVALDDRRVVQFAIRAIDGTIAGGRVVPAGVI